MSSEYGQNVNGRFFAPHSVAGFLSGTELVHRLAEGSNMVPLICLGPGLG